MAQIPEWHVAGDCFDVCKCSIPCPCTFAQTPSFGDCDGVLAYQVRHGHYGGVALDGLNVLAVGHFVGNIWAGETKVTLGMFIDERASEDQREALRLIWSGDWPRQRGNVGHRARGQREQLRLRVGLGGQVQ